MNEKVVKVGVGVIILKDGKVLYGRRKGSWGEGQYGTIGGHLEHGETCEQAILREIAEECGVAVKNLRFLCVSDFLTHYPKHWVDVSFVAEWESGEPQVLEPEKCDGWEWRDLDDIPANVVGPVRGCIEAYKTGKSYFTYPPQTSEAIAKSV